MDVGRRHKTSGQRPETLLLTAKAVARAYHILLYWFTISLKTHESNAKSPSWIPSRTEGCASLRDSQLLETAEASLPPAGEIC